MEKNSEPMKAGKGRQRGGEKSQREIELEDKAKGHLHGEDNDSSESPQAPATPKFRGNQKGFGKNQGKEAGDRSASHGTRAEGAEHG
ncbi:MAG TPA: hypothetical protein EYN91_08590 [Candidatus Melainabacteria bacterium]|nr:hypothetical protein [Candidatus Melainabacteria bacterium]HIN63827.1 hypothetical protein [Candidatus Obscuribacterales bacterium]